MEPFGVLVVDAFASAAPFPQEFEHIKHHGNQNRQVLVNLSGSQIQGDFTALVHMEMGLRFIEAILQE